ARAPGGPGASPASSGPRPASPAAGGLPRGSASPCPPALPRGRCPRRPAGSASVPLPVKGAPPRRAAAPSETCSTTHACCSVAAAVTARAPRRRHARTMRQEPLQQWRHYSTTPGAATTARVHGAGAAGTRVPPRQPCYNKEVHQLAAGRETALARRSFRRFTVIVIVFVVSILFGGAAGMVAGYLRSAPSLDQVVFEQELTSYVYDVHGRRIASLYRENRIPVTLDQMPRHLLDAIVAIEDTRFYEHHGFDVRALLRAAWADVRRMLGHEGFLQGGSTITQQLAKNAFLSHERTLARKLQELLW